MRNFLDFPLSLTVASPAMLQLPKLNSVWTSRYDVWIRMHVARVAYPGGILRKFSTRFARIARQQVRNLCWSYVAVAIWCPKSCPRCALLWFRRSGRPSMRSMCPWTSRIIMHCCVSIWRTNISSHPPIFWPRSKPRVLSPIGSLTNA